MSPSCPRVEDNMWEFTIILFSAQSNTFFRLILFVSSNFTWRRNQNWVVCRKWRYNVLSNNKYNIQHNVCDATTNLNVKKILFKKLFGVVFFFATNWSRAILEFPQIFANNWLLFDSLKTKLYFFVFIKIKFNCFYKKNCKNKCILL